jgi:hypothetical protein
MRIDFDSKTRTTFAPQRKPDLFRKMSSDADYESFLNKANQDPGSSIDASAKTGIKIVNTAVPEVLQSLDEVYVSDSDEPFQAISLTFEGGSLPSETTLSDVLGKKVKKIGEKAFDPRGAYSTVIKAVKSAGDGSVAYFKAEVDATRTEYFVVSVDAGSKRLVGVKALAVET